MSMIGNVGFPIAVCFYTLVRLETTVKANTQAILELSSRIGGADK
jgi:YvrJ protein family